MEQCRHYKDGKCAMDSNCGGSATLCEYIDKDTEGLAQDRFLMRKVMDLLGELREHMTCSLPCIYCKKYDSAKICDGKFEWVYENRIRELAGLNPIKEESEE